MKLLNLFCHIVLVSLLEAAGCSSGGSDKSQGSPHDYEIRGKGLATDAAVPEVRLHHEDVPGLMEGMKMTFKVADAKMLEGLKVGDEVQGRVKKAPELTPPYLITSLEKRGSK